MLSFQEYKMSSTLIICEKNIAAKRIAYILSEGKTRTETIGNIPVYVFGKNDDQCKIIGLKGHIISLDYPADYNQWRKISPHKLINVEPYKKINEKQIAATLKNLAEKNPYIIIATDFDREGELIGVEAIEMIKDKNKNIQNIKRAKFSAITNSEIRSAFGNLVEVDYNLSHAGEARQFIDLVWGAVLTRFISLTAQRLGKEFLSIGRVQSPTLALLVEREKEIQNFVPKPYWKIIATMKKEKTFSATHIEGQFWDEKQANDVFEKVKDCKQALIEKIEKVQNKEYPPAPFSTTTFLQSASALGFSAGKAMNIAESLYTSGLISYPRTDNTVYPPSLNLSNILDKLVKSQFSNEAQEVKNNRRKYPTQGKKKTTDHPPIHPVGVPTYTLNSDQRKIYELVCRRFLATLAKDAISETCNVILKISEEKFTASGYRLIEPNWKKIYIYIKEKRKELPELNEGEFVKITRITKKEDSTKPPKRYTQGALIAKMEQLSLGTKSTRHEIINKLYGRKYINGSPPVPTPTAIAVIDALSDCDVTKTKMTASLEKDMNAIAEGKKSFQNTVNASREMLTKVMNSLEKDKIKIKNNIQKAHNEENTVGKCPKCGKSMIIRTSKNNKRFVGCTGFPDCKNTYSLPQKGSISTTDKSCEACKTPLIKIINKGKNPWELCINSDCPAKKKN